MPVDRLNFQTKSLSGMSLCIRELNKTKISFDNTQIIYWKKSTLLRTIFYATLVDCKSSVPDSRQKGPVKLIKRVKIAHSFL